MTPIYHITHLRNLQTIVDEGGLYSDDIIGAKRLKVQGIAHPDIKQRRARRKVPVCMGGMLSGYMPFYFAP